jgi:predicted Zn-dependent peptidase
VTAAALAFALLLGQEPAQAKERLPNGATVFVERFGRTGTATVALHARASAPEGPMRQGWRHLVEHFAARGATRSVDALLEARGCLLTAETTRDGMTFLVSGPASETPTMLRAVADVLAGFQATDDEVTNEAQIVLEELALTSSAVREARAAWALVPERGVEPAGVQESLSRATANGLQAVYADTFDPERLVLAVSGEVDVPGTVELAKAMLGRVAFEGALEPDPPPLEGLASSGTAVRVASMSQRQTLAVLAVGFGVRERLAGVEMVYTPSPGPAVVTLSGEGVSALRGWSSNDWALARQAGRQILTAYLRALEGSVRERASLRATFLPVEPAFEPEDLRRIAGRMTTEDLDAAEASWRAGAQ